MNREQVMLRQPDEGLPWADFPRIELRRDRTVLYRAVKNGHGPWWFCACGRCRFDLKSPRGTCYAGTDRLCGLLECIGQRLCLESLPPLEPAYLKQWTIHELRMTSTLRLANLTNRRAIGFGVTNELSDIVPYDVAQRYAEVFDRARGSHGGHRFDGIRYRTRFDLGPVARGVAFFDDHGERPWQSRAIEVDDEIVDELKKINVAVDPPALTDLDEDR